MTRFEKQSYRYRNFDRNELLEIITKLEIEVWKCHKVDYIEALEKRLAKMEKRNKRQQQFINKHIKIN